MLLSSTEQATQIRRTGRQNHEAYIIRQSLVNNLQLPDKQILPIKPKQTHTAQIWKIPAKPISSPEKTH